MASNFEIKPKLDPHTKPLNNFGIRGNGNDAKVEGAIATLKSRLYNIDKKNF